MMNKWTGAVALVVAAATLSACATSTRGARALRQHEREPARLAVVLDRFDDIEGSLRLAEQLVAKTPYSPGDPWVQELALTDAEAAAARARLRTTSAVYRDERLRIPTATVYRLHVTGVLARRPAGDAQYGSILEALQDMAAEPAAFAAKWAALDEKRATLADLRRQERAGEERTPDPSNDTLEIRIARLEDQIETERVAVTAAIRAAPVATGEKLQVLTDVAAVLSVAARLELEAAPLVPVVARQLASAPSVEGMAPADLERIASFPGRLLALASSLHTHGELLLDLVDALAAQQSLPRAALPGFALQESAAGEIAGLAWDSIYLDFRAGAEAFYFHHSDDTGSGQAEFDLSDRRFYLKYAVQPIVLADVSLDAGIDAFDIPGFARLDLGYKTDRVYRSGGSIERSTGDLSALGVDGAVSDVLNAGLAIFGIGSSLTVASFTSGEVGLTQQGTGEVIERAPLQFTYTEFELSYDILYAVDPQTFFGLADEFLIGFRLLDYTLPRIVYEFRFSEVEGESGELLRESPPQDVRTILRGGFARIRRGWRRSGSRLLLDFDIGVGGGPSRFTFDGPEDLEQQNAFALMVTGTLGWGYTLAGGNGRFQLDAEVLYYGRAITIDPANETDPDSAPDGVGPATFAGVDYFHGPRAGLRVSF